MLECLRAPNTARGVPAAGELPEAPSCCRGVSMSRRRNCELFMLRAGEWWARTCNLRKTNAKGTAGAASATRAARSREDAGKPVDVMQEQHRRHMLHAHPRFTIAQTVCQLTLANALKKHTDVLSVPLFALSAAYQHALGLISQPPCDQDPCRRRDGALSIHTDARAPPLNTYTRHYRLFALRPFPQPTLTR